MSHLRLFLFGSPRLERDGLSPPMDTRKAMALLAYLAATGQSHSRDTLATLLWPDYEQSQARANLRRTLSTLSKAIGKDSLEIDRETIGLWPQAELWVDVRRFEELVRTSRSHGHPADELCPVCLELLTQAQSLYQADFLAGFNPTDSPIFEEWQFFQAESLRQQIIEVLERLARGHGWLIQLYAWSGQRSAALRQYQSLVRVLADELGISPSQEIETLHQAIEKNRLTPPPLEQRNKSAKTQGGDETPAPLLPGPPLGLKPAPVYNLPT